MGQDIIIKKVWTDELSTLFNVKFITFFNCEDFIISGNYYISKPQLEELAKNLSKASGSVIFGSKKSKDYCKLTISQSERGYININYSLVSQDGSYGLKDKIDMSLNTGYIIEPAILDRITSRLKDFYDEPEGSKISLIHFEN